MRNAAMLAFVTAIAVGCGSTETSPFADGGGPSAVGSGGSGAGGASTGGNTGGHSSAATASGGSGGLADQPSNPTDGGAGGNSNAGPATLDDVRAVCQAQADFLARCRGIVVSDSAAYVTNCVSQTGDPKLYRTDFLRVATTCNQHADDCTNVDTCTIESVAAINPDWQQDSLYKLCVAYVTDCSGRTVGFSFGTQSCVAAIVTVDAIHASLAACFSESCETMRACYDMVMGKVH